jgi:hypothetical protein
MTNRIVPTPGDGMRRDGCPRIAIDGGGDRPRAVTVNYYVGQHESEDRPQFVELTFLDVIELRWIEWEVDYDTHPQHEDDFEFALIEIIDSAYAAALGVGAARHFRMGVDDWGELNVFARDVQIRVVDAPDRGEEDEHRAMWAFTGGGNRAVCVTIRAGNITFSGVLECRWIEAGHEYDDHAAHADDRGEGLREIVDSAYVVAMDAMGWRQRPGRLRLYEDRVRHFRVGLASSGELNVIATGVSNPADEGRG